MNINIMKKKEEEEKMKREKQQKIDELEIKKLNLHQKVSVIVKNKLEHMELLSGFFPDASADFSLVKINIEINEIQLNVKRCQEEKLFTIILKNFILFGDIKNRKQLITLTINDISMRQYQLPESKYQMLMTTVAQKTEKLNAEEKKKLNACYIEFENNPDFDNSNFRIKIRNQKRIILIANIFSLEYISTKISNYLNFFIDQNFDFPEKYNVSGEIYKYIKDGFKYDNLQTILQHFNADLDVLVKSPIFLFPIDILDNNNKKCILVRCGDFRMFSLLPPRQDPKIDYSKIKERQKLFDTYVLKSEKLCVTTLDDFDGDLSGLLNAKGLNLIEDVSFGLNADIMFEHKNPYFEKFKLGINVGKCKINVRDIQLPFFMEMIEKSGKLIKLSKYELEHKTYFEKKEIKFNKEEEETYNINNLKNKNNLEKIENNINDKKEEKKEDKKVYMFNEENININYSIKFKEYLIKEDKKDFNINDPKFLILNFHLDNFQFCIQKTISYGEKQILLKSKDENMQNLKYRDFILFEMNHFKIEFLLTEKYNINVTLLIKSIEIIDKETLITNINNPQGDLYINPEFQHIIKMESGEKSNEVDRTSSYQSNMGSNDYSMDDSIFLDLNQTVFIEKNNVIKNKIVKDEYEDYFLILKFQHNNENQTQYADILLKKIKICIAMSTISRILQFTFYYLEMFNKIIEENLIIWENMEREHKKEKMKNRLIRKMKSNNYLISSSNDSRSLNSSISEIDVDDDSDEESEIEDNNKLFDSKFASKLAEDINKKKEKENEDILIINNNNINNNKDNNDVIFNKINKKYNDDVDKEAEQSLKNKEIKLSKIFRTKNYKLNIKIKFEMRETSLIYPLDDSKSVTKVLKVKSNINGNNYLKTNIDLIRDGNDKLIKIVFNENHFKTGIKIINVELNILNYQNGIYSIDNICDRILTGFRFCLNINSILLLPKKEQNLTMVNIDLEPLVFNIGFIQIKSFISFLPILQEFLKDIKTEYDDPIKEIEDFEDIERDNEFNINNNNIIEEDTNKINGEINDDLNIISTSTKNNNNIINLEDDNKNVEKFKDKRRSKRKKRKKMKKKKKNDETQNNILDMNNTFDIKINMEKILIKILDDSGYCLKPLLNIEFRQPPLKLILNTNSDSVKNISNLLVETISRKELSLQNYDIKNLALHGEFIFSFSVTFYNNRIEDWEPIIEKYEASITLDQIAWFSRLRILYNSNTMLNLNLSFSILCMINDVLKKILTSELKGCKINDIAVNSDEKIAIEFINLSGIDITCWLDAEDIIKNADIMDNYKFLLHKEINSKRNKKKIKKNKLNKIYNKLTDAQLKIKKDKFSFKVEGYTPISGNDFSSNYTTCFKLKKDFSDRYIVENNSKKNQEYEINVEENNLLLLKDQLLPENINTEENIIDTSINKKVPILIDDDNEDECVEIYIKIRKNGNLKSIVFESNIFFYNNLQIPISLSLISENDFINKYNSNDNNINHEKNTDKLVLSSGTKKSLSLKYLIKRYRIYISFHNILSKDNNYSLLYNNFNLIKNNRKNFIKYEQENLPTYKGKKETELKDYYSKLIPIKHKNKTFYISSNLIIQHGSSDIIKSNNIDINKNININNKENQSLIEDSDSQSNISLINDMSYIKDYSYLFILNESLVIENQLPFNIKCLTNENNNNKEISIKPLQNKYFLDINKDTKLRFIINYQDKNFISNYIDMKKIREKYLENKNDDNKNKEFIETTLILYEGNNEAINKDQFIECNIKIEENIENDKMIGAYEKEFEYNVKSFSKKRKIIIYNKCIIINKTNYLLYLKSHDIKIQHFNKENFNGKIFPNSINLLNTKDVKNTFELKSEQSNWSQKFNINTIGHIGVISLEIAKEKKDIIDLEIGISITSSWNFPNSLFITFEPRFLLINKFGYDLQYKQYNNKKDKISNEHGKQFKEQLIKNEDQLQLNLLKGSKNMKKMIQIKMGEYSSTYSCPIDLDEIGDVDIKIPINEEMKKIILKKNLEIEKKLEKIKRLKKRLKFIEEKMKHQGITKTEINENNKDNININNNDDDNNIINTNNDNIDSNNIDNIENSNININNLINDNKNNENNYLLNQIINNENNILNSDDLGYSEREKTISSLGIDEDDETSTDVFSFTQKSEKFLSKKEEKKELTPTQEKLKKIEERKKKLQEVQMKPRKYFIFSQNDQSFLLLRVTKSIYKSLIYIVIFPPENPQYIIKNETNYFIELRQFKDEFNCENIILEKGGVIPYAWGDTLKNEKLLLVSIDGNEVDINLNEIKVIRQKMEVSEQFLIKNNEVKGIRKKTGITKSFFFQTTIENNRTRTLIVKSNHQIKKDNISFMERIKEQKKNSFNIKLKLYTKGFGISIIDSVPKELFYISFYGLLIEGQLFNFNKDQCSHIISNIKISLKNFQIDYCLKDLFKSMIIPQNQITPQIEELNQDNINLIPLMQGIVSFHRITNNLISVSSDEFPQLDFTIQPIKVNVSNYQLMKLIDFGLQLKNEFDFYLTEPEKSKKFNNIEDLEKFLSEENSPNKIMDEYEPEHYDPLLNTQLSIMPEEIIYNSEKRYMFFIKNIAIGSLVIILTTRIDLNSFRVIPLIVSGLSSFIGNIFTHITDYNLYLPSLYYTDVFTDIYTLGSQLVNSYLNQLKRRIFKIIGSLDIIGNPTGYATSISKGFLEIFEAPRRGLIHGPLGFGEGVAKGFGTFITTVISSSFDIVGKISGTLLASCEELQGIKNTEYLSEREPSNILTGLYYGVKNGIIDIGKGFAGIFIKPYQEAKKSGIGGFFQGVGAGLLGAAVSPFTAGLRITNNLFVGIKNTALMFNPKLNTERFRYPRTIQKAIRLNSYDEHEALVRAILDYLNGYEEHEIIYFKQFKYIHPGLQGSFSTLILTDKCVMIVYQAKELVFKINLDLIKSVEVHQEPNRVNFDLIFYLKNNTRKFVRTNNMSACFDFYLMFENTKE